jgi:hypothetical protein
VCVNACVCVSECVGLRMLFLSLCRSSPIPLLSSLPAYASYHLPIFHLHIPPPHQEQAAYDLETGHIYRRSQLFPSLSLLLLSSDSYPTLPSRPHSIPPVAIRQLCVTGIPVQLAVAHSNNHIPQDPENCAGLL